MRRPSRSLSRPRRLLSAFGLVLAGATAACSFVLTRTQGQCNSHADCASRGGEFVNSVCTDSHVCVPLESLDTKPPTGKCAKNSDCGDVTRLCRDGECRSLKPDAPLKCDALKNPALDEKLIDGALVVGVLAPIEQQGGFGDPIQLANTVSAGINEFYRVAQNRIVDLPPIMGVLCDESDADSIRYMTEKLKVRTVIGPTQARNIVPALDILKDVGAVLVSSRADDPLFEESADPTRGGAFWRFRLNRRHQIKPLGAAIRALLPKVPAPQSVLIAAGSDASTADFVQRLQASDAGVPYPVANYTALGEPNFADYNALVSKITTDKPRLVVAASSVDRWEDIIAGVESNWGSDPRPTYLLMDKSPTVEVRLLLIENNLHTGIAQRVFGLNPHRDTSSDAYRQFQQALGASAVYGAEVGYDALYETVYALLLASRNGGNPGQIPPSDFAKSIEALNGPNGIPSSVGALSIPDVIKSFGQKINLVGASGPLDFDLAKGSPPNASELYCVTSGKFCDTNVLFAADSDGPPTGTSACSCFN